MNYDLVFKTGGREYHIECPTNGQMLEVERLKALYSNNNYSGILASRSVGSNYALDMIDMNSYLKVFCEDIFSDDGLKVESVFQLGLLDVKPLYNDFLEQFIPWIRIIEKAMKNEPRDKKED